MMNPYHSHEMNQEKLHDVDIFLFYSSIHPSLFFAFGYNVYKGEFGHQAKVMNTIKSVEPKVETVSSTLDILMIVMKGENQHLIPNKFMTRLLQDYFDTCK